MVDCEFVFDTQKWQHMYRTATVDKMISILLVQFHLVHHISYSFFGQGDSFRTTGQVRIEHVQGEPERAMPVSSLTEEVSWQPKVPVLMHLNASKTWSL